MASKPSSELSASLRCNYTGDKEMLGKCEQFFMELMKVPRTEAKLRVFSFKITFDSQVKESAELRQIMQKNLTVGNDLNQGTARGSAVRFKLDSLLKLSDTRARNNKMTLMHYLCKLIGEKVTELRDFANDLAHLESASNIKLKTLAEEMQAETKGLEKVMQELMASENDGEISLGFRKVLKDFLETAEEEVRSLYIQKVEKMQILCLTTSLRIQLDVLSSKENEKQAESEKKKLEKEAMKEKSATKKDGPHNDN